eukprot:TRINITY_DN3856_c0_g2_i1.p2 TRINITY_DN3856_c0_g2~~TRINITY_DN3856_c0_g2_i1.p2  ORF type:complete len:168 (+),score=55.43 TRINITY_DN3856_c0_g2_i1:641-1144(+)
MKKKLSQHKIIKPIAGEIIKPIKLDIRINNFLLRDQFLWDINNPANSPEVFASTIIADLGLTNEFFLPIAHSIREQIRQHWNTYLQEEIYKAPAADKSAAEGAEQDPLKIFRNPGMLESHIITAHHNYEQTKDTALWSPMIQQLTEDEVKKFEKQEERNARYAKRRK